MRRLAWTETRARWLGALVLFVAAGALTTPGRLAAQEDPVSALTWLAGCWTAGSGENAMDEVWLAPRGGIMVGVARSVRGGVATGHEFLVIRSKEERLVYSAYPSGQQPTDFEVTAAAPGLLRAENADHDFPRRIEYRLHPPDSLVASVFAEVDGISPAFEVPYARAVCPD